MPDGLGDGGLGAKAARRVGEAFSATARNPGLLRAQLSFGAAWTAEAAFTVALGVVAFVDGGAEAVGLVAFARMVPAALFTPVATAFADRFPRDRVLEVIGNGRLVSTLRSGEGFGEIALLHDTLRTTTVRARTPLLLFTLDRRHFLSAVTDYESSGREAEALVLDRPGRSTPRTEPRNLSRLRIAVDALA